MSYLRDIQKLRQNRTPYQPSFTHRFSQPQHQPDIYNLNFEKGDESKTMFGKFAQTHHKYGGSKELLSKNKEKKIHKRGHSNGNNLLQPKESQNALSIYNFSMKLNNRAPNALTSRKEKPPQTPNFEDLHEIREKKHQQAKIIKNTGPKIGKANFNVLYPVGKGGFGKVWKVQYKRNNQTLAMKEMYKAKIIQKKSINSVMNERTLLAKVNHPFLINMICAFQDRQNLYLLMDYLDGGDLRYHIGRRRRFTENQTQFFIANMIVGLEYLHKNKIIHRDMKPENLVFDSDGYLRVTDLGISRVLREDNYQDTSGTPGYMAPQVICKKNHSFAVDLFAVGVMGYEFMLGRRPYIGRNRKQIRDQILSKQAGIKSQDLPSKWSVEAADLINKLLQRNPANRLGNNGIQEIKQHPWFKTLDWAKLLKKQIPAPYVPISIEENYDDYKEQISEDSIDDNLEENLLMLRKQQVQTLFEGYYYDRQPQKRRISSFTTNNSESDYRK